MDLSDDPPQGYRLLPAVFEGEAGYDPIRYHAKRVRNALALGFRVGPQHLNPGGVCHGGVLAAFCDIQLAFAVMFATPDLRTTILPTVSLTLDYLAAVRPGAWVEAVGGKLAVTRNLAFASSLVTADGQLSVRASGTYKAGGGRVTAADTGAWLRAAVDRPWD